MLATTLAAKLVGERLHATLDVATLPTTAVLAIGLLVSKVVVDLNLGQIDLLLGLLLVLSAILLPQRPAQAGAALAIVAAFKLIGLLFLPWLLIRRAWRAAAALAMTYTTLWLVMTPWLGWRVGSEYFVLLAGNGSTGMLQASTSDRSVETTSLSAAAGLRRLLTTWEVNNGIATSLLLPGVVGLLLWYMYRRHKKSLFARRFSEDKALDLVEFAAIPAAAIALHSYSHNRHWCLAILLFVIMANLLIVPGPRKSRAMLLAVGSVVVLHQIRLQDVLGLELAWDRMGGTGWTMLLAMLTVLWVVLRDDPTMRSQMIDPTSSPTDEAASLAKAD
jgi:hypothetical protein